MFINVDDEQNILKMHKKLFAKCEINLNCCNCTADFASTLIKVHQDFINSKINFQELLTAEKPVVFAIMDHMLDREFG